MTFIVTITEYWATRYEFYSHLMYYTQVFLLRLIASSVYTDVLDRLWLTVYYSMNLINNLAYNTTAESLSRMTDPIAGNMSGWFGPPNATSGYAYAAKYSPYVGKAQYLDNLTDTAPMIVKVLGDAMQRFSIMFS